MKRTYITIVLAILALVLNCFQSSAQRKYSDIFQMLSGIPGVMVTAASSSNPSVIIRGVGTNSGHTEPLYLVDNVQCDNISTINPDDVDSIDIIKDGSSSIYGMQGANGVILITTKGAVQAAKAEAEAKKAERKARRNKELINAVQATRDRNEALAKADSLAKAHQ